MYVTWNEANRHLIREYGEGPFEVIKASYLQDTEFFEVKSEEDGERYGFFADRFDVIDTNITIADLI